jgi:hypothetical protein
MTIARLIVAAFVSLFVAGSFACRGDDDNATATPGVCQQKEELKSSLTDLADLNVVASGTDALHESVDKVKSETEDMKKVASADVQDEVDALDSAVGSAEDTLNDINSSDSLNEKIDQVQAHSRKWHLREPRWGLRSTRIAGKALTGATRGRNA